MNISAGKPIDKGKEASSITPKTYISSFMDTSFSGHLVITGEGLYGIEEGILLFNDGNIIASSYSYFSFNKEFKAMEALSRTLNAFKNKKSIIDTYSLASYQVQLVTSLNGEYLLDTPVNKTNLTTPSKYSTYYEQQLIDDEKKQSSLNREDLLKKFNLIMSPRQGSEFRKSE